MKNVKFYELFSRMIYYRSFRDRQKKLRLKSQKDHFYSYVVVVTNPLPPYQMISFPFHSC